MLPVCQRNPHPTQDDELYHPYNGCAAGKSRVVWPHAGLPARYSRPACLLSSPMTEPYITFDNLTIGYDSQPVLTGISLSIAQGSFTAILGANGSGKSSIPSVKSQTYVLAPNDVVQIK